jgi:hypothetical protein
VPKVAAGAEANLQDLAGCHRSKPLSTRLEEQGIHRSDPSVVPLRRPVVEGPNAAALIGNPGHGRSGYQVAGETWTRAIVANGASYEVPPASYVTSTALRM